MPVDLGPVPVLPNLDDGAIKGKLTNIHNQRKQANLPSDQFTVVGNPLLLSIAEVIQPTAKLEGYAQQFAQSIQFYTPGFQNVVAVQQSCGDQTALTCQGALNGAVVFLDMGSKYLAENKPLDQAEAELKGTVQNLNNAGFIVILVTIPGPTNDPKVMEYNTVIYKVAEAEKAPLFNLYKIGVDKPNLLQNGILKDPGPGKRADFSTNAPNEGLNEFGVNVATLDMLTLLDELRAKIIGQ